MAYDGAARKGSAILIQKGAVTLAGLRTKTFAINSETVDVTSADNVNRWRELLAAAGIKTMSVSGSGVLKDTASHQAAAADVIAQTVDAYTLTVPGLGVFTGNFQMTQFQSGGEYNGEATFDISLESGGDVTFTPEG